MFVTVVYLDTWQMSDWCLFSSLLVSTDIWLFNSLNAPPPLACWKQLPAWVEVITMIESGVGLALRVALLKLQMVI